MFPKIKDPSRGTEGLNELTKFGGGVYLIRVKW